jgi:GGDEF domain-containing protein
VAQDPDPGRVSTLIADGLVEIFDVQTAAVARFTGPDQAEILAITPASLTAVEPGRVRVDPQDGSALSVMRATGRAARTDYSAAGGERPITIGGTLWGGISVATTDPTRIDDDGVAALEKFAELVELAMGNTRMLADLEHQASVDDLTGLPNRRTLLGLLETEVERSRGRRRPLTMAVLDLDRFKMVNDEHGHPVGDVVLREVARRLGEATREGDVVGRLGGEEFGWVLPDTDLDHAVSVTVSIGLCPWSEEMSPADLVRAADVALYDAKRAGRDRVSVWS